MKGETQLFALRSYTIKQHNGSFFVAPTAQEGQHRWSKPYASLQHATTAIGRKLQREFVMRDRRLNGSEHTSTSAPRDG